jgi:hypothetical protein
MGLWSLYKKPQQPVLSLIRADQFCSKSHLVEKSLPGEILLNQQTKIGRAQRKIKARADPLAHARGERDGCGRDASIRVELAFERPAGSGRSASSSCIYQLQ